MGSFLSPSASSSSSSPSSSVRATFLALLDDAEVRAELKQIVAADIKEEAVRARKQSHSSVRLSPSFDDLVAFASSYYSSASVQEWREVDDAGDVYGWAGETVEFCIINDAQSDLPLVLALLRDVSRAELATIRRALFFFHARASTLHSAVLVVPPQSSSYPEW